MANTDDLITLFFWETMTFIWPFAYVDLRIKNAEGCRWDQNKKNKKNNAS